MRDFTTREQVVTVYDRLAPNYDWSARLLDRLGFGYERLRREAIDALGLQPGDLVVEIGCGTGANFAYLEELIGPNGRIIGVDLSAGMLDKARERIDANGWTNIGLVQSPAADFQFPEDGVDAVLSTFALTLEPEYDATIARIAQALRPGRRFATADLKLASGWRLIFLPPLLLITRPFAVSLKLASRHPWEAMRRHLTDLAITEHFGGYLYVASAVAPGGSTVRGKPPYQAAEPRCSYRVSTSPNRRHRRQRGYEGRGPNG